MAFVVRIKNAGTNFATAQLKSIDALSKEHLKLISDETVKILRFHVQTSIQRPGSTGNLAEAFFAERVGLNSYGIGKISYLNKTVPYWRWINYGRAASGRTIPPGSGENPMIRGGFTPGNSAPSATSFQSGRFQLNGTYFMNPKKPIQAHNFLQRTVAQIPTIVKSVLGE